jgi:hypothetical protein
VGSWIGPSTRSDASSLITGRLAREPAPDRTAADPPSPVAQFAAEIVWSRAYRLVRDDQAVFAIANGSSDRR